MDDHEVQTQAAEDTTVTKVTYDDLSAAFDADSDVPEQTDSERVIEPAVAEEPEPQKEPEPIPPVKTETQEEHEERSRLGRKVKELSEQMVTKSEFQQLMARLDEMKGKPPVEVEEEPADITSVDELHKQFEKWSKAREASLVEQHANTVKNYQEAYMDTLSEIGKDLPPEEFSAVVDVIKTKYNAVDWSSPNLSPERDCAKSFVKAMKEVSGMKKEPPNKFEANKGKEPPAVNVPVARTDSEKPLPELDPIAAEYVKSRGMSPEKVRQALEAPMSLGLMGTKHKIK